jgi:pimeloyl-ACP methyl ester carboxylesterase
MPSDNPPPASPSAAPIPIQERGVIIAEQRIATAMNDAPRALLARAPVVLLPAFGFVWGDYRGILERLAPERRVFALNWPGSGGSAHPTTTEFAYTPAHLTQILTQWLDGLGIARAVLLAGGGAASVAVRFAAAQPTRALALALVGPLGVVPRSALDAAGHSYRSLTLLRLAERTLTSLALGPTTEETRAIEERRAAQRAEAGQRARTLPATVALWRALDAAQPETLMLAHGIEEPCAVIRGGLDPLCSAGDARVTAEALGAHGALEVTLPQAGHLPHLQQPERFYQALSGLINAAEAGV